MNENMSFRFEIMDLSKVSIMSRGLEVDQKFCDQYRIKYIYNRIESIDTIGMDGIELHREIREKMEMSSKILLGRVISTRGSCMLVEGGLKSVGNGQVIITTIFHFEDSYSMNVFILKYPHKMWNHMKDLYILTN